ncbi:MAG TPA: hypothetical protein VN132_09900 [Bdellovibrio sp.]|nr:hypothetical protein [Bdellovibrio sp.]
MFAAVSAFLFLLIGLYSASSFAQSQNNPGANASTAIGFLSGSEFQATPIDGTVVITCDGFNGTSQANYSCRDVVLDPQSSDIFAGPREPRAKQVELLATHEDGTTRTKTSNYDGQLAQSTSSFNLWINTLFQKPLLMTGINRIHYTLYNGSTAGPEEFGSGNFTVTVKRGTARHCPTSYYHSTDVIDCNSQYSICQRYFDQYNSCR